MNNILFPLYNDGKTILVWGKKSNTAFQMIILSILENVLGVAKIVLLELITLRRDFQQI